MSLRPFVDELVDYLTLAVPEKPEVITPEVIVGFIEFMDEPMDMQLAQAIRKARQGPRITKFQASVAAGISIFSRIMAAALGLEERTVTAHIAVGLRTTSQGAHMYMIDWALMDHPATSVLVKKTALEITRLEAASSCAQHGNADEMMRFTLRHSKGNTEARALILKECPGSVIPVQLPGTARTPVEAAQGLSGTPGVPWTYRRGIDPFVE